MKRVVVCLLVAVSVTAAGCVRVRAHQRGIQAKRAMTNDVDPAEGRFKAHERGAREGADLGTNQPGGGCGCN